MHVLVATRYVSHVDQVRTFEECFEGHEVVVFGEYVGAEQLPHNEHFVDVGEGTRGLPSELCDNLLLLCSYSTPSCIDDVIEKNQFVDYEALNKVYHERMMQYITEKHAEEYGNDETVKQGEDTSDERGQDCVILIMYHHFFLLPEMLKTDAPLCNIIYNMGLFMPAYELMSIIPFKKQLLQALLNVNVIIFNDFKCKDEFRTSMTDVLGVYSQDHVIPRSTQTNGQKIELVVLTYVPRDIDESPTTACQSSRPANRTRVLSVETSLISYENLRIRLKGIQQLLQEKLIDECEVYICKEQTFGTDWPIRFISGPGDVPDVILSYVSRINLELGPCLKLRMIDSLREIEDFCDYNVLIVGESFNNGATHIVKKYIENTSSVSKRMVMISESTYTASLLAMNLDLKQNRNPLNDVIIFNPYNCYSIYEHVKRFSERLAANQGRQAESWLDVYVKKLYSKYTPDLWLANLRKIVLPKIRRCDSFEGCRIDKPEAIAAKFFGKRSERAAASLLNIVVCGVQGILGTPELTAVNRLVLPYIVVNWDRSNADLFVTTQLGVRAMADFVGNYNILVDADNGHYRKALDEYNFEWICGDIGRKECQRRLVPVIELMEYYRDRTPGSFISKSETSAAFHIHNYNHLGIKTLRELTAQMQAGVIGQDRHFRIDVGDRMVRVLVNHQQRRVALEQGLKQIISKRLQYDWSQFDPTAEGRRMSECVGEQIEQLANVICIGGPQLTDMVSSLCPSAMTVAIADPFEEDYAQYRLRNTSEVITLLRLIQHASRPQVRPPPPKKRSSNLLAAIRPSVDWEYSPSAIGVLLDDASPTHTGAPNDDFYTPASTPLGGTPPRG